MLNIVTTIEDGKATVAISGRLDTLTAPDLSDALAGIYDGITELVFDCEGLNYVSSAGLRVFLSAQKRMNAQGEMKLIHVNDVIMDIFEVTAFTDILTIE